MWEILANAGLPPAPRRGGPTWAQFRHGQAQAILATDFFTVDLLDGTTAYVLAVLEHATRRIRILSVTAPLMTMTSGVAPVSVDQRFAEVEMPAIDLR